MPKRSRSGVVSRPARVVAPTSVNCARSIFTERAAGPSPMIRSSWIVLHRGIEDFLDRRIEPVDLVDEQHVALFQIGEQRREVAGLGDDRPGGGAEIHAELARDDLRQRGLAEAGRADEQHVIERLFARARRLDEHREVGARLRLPDEFGEPLRAQRGVRVLVAALGGDEAAGRGGHLASSFSPSRISCVVSAPSPAARDAAAIAAAACG